MINLRLHTHPHTHTHTHTKCGIHVRFSMAHTWLLPFIVTPVFVIVAWCFLSGCWGYSWRCGRLSPQAAEEQEGQLGLVTCTGCVPFCHHRVRDWRQDFLHRSHFGHASLSPNSVVGGAVGTVCHDNHVGWDWDWEWEHQYCTVRLSLAIACNK